MRRPLTQRRGGRPRRSKLLALIALIGVAWQTPGSTGSAPAAEERPGTAELGARAYINWPKYHLDFANTGHNPYETHIGTGNVSTLSVTWTFGAGAVEGTTALWKGTIYCSGTIGGAVKVSAIDATNGLPIWMT